MTGRRAALQLDPGGARRHPPGPPPATANSFIWPPVVIPDTAKQIVAVGLTQFTVETGVTILGSQTAAHVFATIPVVMLFLLGMRYYVEG